ncbi:MAG: DUF3310 domain-containing protein [Aeromonadaceae bacterium]
MNESTLVPIEEMSDLDLLARNVHVWPYERQAHCYVMTGSGGKKELSASASSPFFSKFTLDQWLARRAELQNKPSWKDAPEWAQWLAHDARGYWWWHSDEPTKMSSLCYSGGGKHMMQCKGHILGDWRDTLEKRPEQKAFKPFVSVEDAATAKQHDPVNSPSHYASGGIECIESIKASMSHEAFLGYLKGNVQKYMWRYEKKVNPAEDLKKAQWYLSKLIEEQK